MTTKTLEQVLSDIDTSSAAPELREMPIPVGYAAQQGDVYLHKVPSDWKRGKLLGTRQIAVGEGIGSRHIVEGNVEVYEGAKLPNGCKPPEGASIADLLGPVVVVKSDAVLTHPKHAHFALERGVYQVTYPYDHTTKAREMD